MVAAQTHSQPGLGEYLVREGYITQSQFNRAIDMQHETSRSMGRILVDMGLITDSMRMSILQKQFGFKRVNLKDADIEKELLQIIPYSFAEKHRAVPVLQEADLSLVVAMEDPSDLLVVDALKKQIGLEIKPHVASQEDIQSVLGKYGAITSEEEVARVERKKGRSWLYLLLKHGAFPVLALAPLVGFFVAIGLDLFDLAGKLNDLLYKEQILSKFDLFIYIALVWGLWTIILFEINGLIFGRGSEEEE